MGGQISMDLSLKILLLIALLQIKHLIADFYLQTVWMLTNRERYLHLGRATHATIHSAFSVIIFALFGTPLTWLVVLFLLEFVIHFHVDCWKARENIAKSLTPQDAGFWRAMGMDQTVHHLTNLFMVWLWVTYIAA